MPVSAKSTALPSPALVAVLNALPNVFWSVAVLGPVGVFGYQHMARPWLYGLLAVSLLGYMVPVAWFRYWQLSRTAHTYRRWRVPAINRVTQHGDWLNRLLRRWYPRYRHVRSRASLAALVRTTYQQERFHAVLLVFFLLASLTPPRRGVWAGPVSSRSPTWATAYTRCGSSNTFGCGWCRARLGRLCGGDSRPGQLGYLPLSIPSALVLMRHSHGPEAM